MSRRRKKDPPPAEQVSAKWESYNPWEPLYWKSGGPFVPVGQVETAPIDANQGDPDRIGHNLPPSARLKYAERELARCEQQLDEHVAWYTRYHDKGLDALTYEQDRQAAREIETDPVRYATVPSPLDFRRASSYRMIGYFRSRIAI